MRFLIYFLHVIENVNLKIFSIVFTCKSCSDTIPCFFALVKEILTFKKHAKSFDLLDFGLAQQTVHGNMKHSKTSFVY